jgi:hypothetical protein
LEKQLSVMWKNIIMTREMKCRIRIPIISFFLISEEKKCQGWQYGIL